MAPTNGGPTVPVLLLKTKSTPSDAYEEIFLSTEYSDGKVKGRFEPHFVPVLLHRFEEKGIQKLDSLLRANEISDKADSKYGGMIFTSQRAVEAFCEVLRDKKSDGIGYLGLQNVPIYSVGPATTRALRAAPMESSLQIFGEHTGNGEALASYILEHYREWYSDRDTLPPLLFLVGEQRRDIIPRMLMNSDLPARRRIQVDEEIVYGTGTMESFPSDLRRVLHDTNESYQRWIVVFSPTGCDSMLRELGQLDPNTEKATVGHGDGKTFIATIGPTTKSHLVTNFDFEPHACADLPSPSGILGAIVKFASIHP